MSLDDCPRFDRNPETTRCVALMTNYGRVPPQVAIILGCGDVGSAVAVTLHRAGFAVVIADEADPPWHRRGMTFTDAWYTGIAELDGEGACFCASLKSVPSILARRMIAATTWSWPGIAAAFEPALLVDARGRKRHGYDNMRGRAPFTICIGSGVADAGLVDMAIPAMSAESGATESAAADQVSRDRVAVNTDGGASTIEARRHGRFMTDRRIGDTVRKGEVVGGLGNDPIRAPSRGVLLGLAARGARIEPGDILVEVDPVGAEHECYGVSKDAGRTARRVLEAFETGVGSSSCCNTASPQSRDSVIREEYPQCANI